MKTLLVSVCLLVETMSEPPAPEQYGPPAGGHSESSDHVRSGPSSTRAHARPSSPSAQYGVPSSGYGSGGDDHEQPANYEFQYDVSDQEMGLKFGHEEQREGEVAQGKYYVLLPDGRTQTVEYVADQDGFRPKISYEGGEGHSSGGLGGQGGHSGGGSGEPTRGATAGFNK